MRFSTCRISISVSSCPSRCSRRALTSNISSTCCFCSSFSGRCAATVSARRPASSMPPSEVRISGGIFLFNFTYWSNCVTSALAHGLDLVIVARIRRDGAGHGHVMAALVLDFLDDRTLAAFDQHLNRAIRQLEHLQYVGDAADLIPVSYTHLRAHETRHDL